MTTNSKSTEYRKVLTTNIEHLHSALPNDAGLYLYTLCGETVDKFPNKKKHSNLRLCQECASIMVAKIINKGRV